MSILTSNISVSRHRLNLLAGLVDWWDSGSSTGQHSGVTFLNASYSLNADPFGGNLAYYAVAGSDTFRPALPTNISALNPWTVACVFYKGAGIQLYTLAAGAGVTNPGIIVNADGSVAFANWFDQVTGLGTIAGAGTVSTGWHSFVTSYASGVVSFYLDGALLASRSVSHTTATFQPAFCYFFRLGTEARCAVGAIATRAWTLADAAVFHNAGSYKRYRDFSGFEPETSFYALRIISANSSISINNLKAVDTFIKGCKSDGNWNSIKASCLLAGPNTLAGALVPLVGTAPSNVGFLDTDYNRTTGLVGDGLTKYLNSNRNDSADPTNNASAALWVTGIPPSTTGVYLSRTNAAGVSGRYLRNANANSFRPIAMCNNGGAGATTSHTQTASVSGFVGISRNNSTDYTFRYNGVNDTVVKTSSDPSAAAIHIFKQGNSSAAGVYTNARFSFYSIGEAFTDISLLDARLATYMSSLI